MKRVHAALLAACTFFLLISGSPQLFAAPNDPYFVFYNVSVLLTVADLGLGSNSIAHPHGNFQATSGWQDETVSGTELPLTEYPSVSSVTRTNILFWQYFNGKKKENFSVSFSLTKPTLTSQANSSSHIVIASATPHTVVQSDPQPGGPYWTYSGYGDIVFNISQASYSGLYTGGVITQKVTTL